MKVVTKMMLLVLVLATFALPMVITGPNDRPLMTLDDWIPAVELADKRLLSGGVAALKKAEDVSVDQSPHNPVLLQQSRPQQKFATSGQMYKWQDKQGRWHFSTEQPADLTGVAVEDLPDIKNVMEAAVNQGQNSSTISLPDLSNAGALLERL